MVRLTEEMKEVFSKNKIFAIATASKAGIPNVAPMASVQLVSDDTIWLGDNFLNKTLANVKENPHMAIYFWEPEKKRCFQIKGSVTVKTSGPDYEKERAQIKAKGPHTRQRGCLCSPSPRYSNAPPARTREKRSDKPAA